MMTNRRRPIMPLVSLLAMMTGFALGFGGCATAPLPGITDTKLRANPAELLYEARRELSAAGVRISDESANALMLGEVIGEEISSFAADGAPSQYTVNYRLAFSFNGVNDVVELSETVDYAAGLYHAGRRQRESAAESLRQSAIAEMLQMIRPSDIRHQQTE